VAAVFAALASNMLPQLGARRSLPGGVHHWLFHGNFVPEESGSADALRLSVGSYSDLLPYLTYDFERFSFAGAQSFSSALRDDTGDLPQTAWRLLKLYYGAFFSAHAVLRSQGFGELYLQTPVIQRVNELVSLYGEEYPLLEAGAASFDLTFPESGSQAMMNFERSLKGSGVHDVFWRAFCLKLSVAAARFVEAGMPDSEDFVAGVTDIASNVRFAGEGSGAWLSQVRNNINYQHDYDTWYPQAKGSAAREAVRSLRVGRSDTFRLDFSKAKQTMQTFVDVCNFLCCLNVELAGAVAARSSVGGAFGQKWRRLLTAAGNLSL
jgi:hypothetical protein